MSESEPTARVTALRSPFLRMRLALPGVAEYLPLPLGLSYPTLAHSNYWRQVRTAEPLAGFRAGIHKRDYDACRFCGFVSRKYQEIVARDGRDWDLDATVTACGFCAQCLTLDTVPRARSGVLIHLPEVSQGELNLIAHVIYVCRLSQGTPAEKARNLLDQLVSRREAAKRQAQSDNPEVLAAQLAECRTVDSYCSLQERVRDIRLLPLDRFIVREGDLEFNKFPQMLAYWRSKNGPFGSLLPSSMDLSRFDEILTCIAA